MDTALLIRTIGYSTSDDPNWAPPLRGSGLYNAPSATPPATVPTSGSNAPSKTANGADPASNSSRLGAGEKRPLIPPEPLAAFAAHQLIMKLDLRTRQA